MTLRLTRQGAGGTSRLHNLGFGTPHPPECTAGRNRRSRSEISNAAALSAISCAGDKHVHVEELAKYAARFSVTHGYTTTVEVRVVRRSRHGSRSGHGMLLLT